MFIVSLDLICTFSNTQRTFNYFTQILYSVFSQPISASAAYILSEVCRDKYDAVLPLVRLLLHHHKLVPFVAAVAELDLKDTQYVFHVYLCHTF